MKIRYVLTILISFTLTGILVAANVYRQTVAGSNSADEATHDSLNSPGGQEPNIGPIRNLRFTLFDAGIRPSEMRIKAGLVNILIEDRTQLAQGVALRRILGSERVAVGTIQKAVDQSRGRNSFRLVPGEYELYDPKQSANKAVLLVEP